MVHATMGTALHGHVYREPKGAAPSDPCFANAYIMTFKTPNRALYFKKHDMAIANLCA